MAKRTRKPRTAHTCGSCPACAKTRRTATQAVAKTFDAYIDNALQYDPCDWLDDTTIRKIRALDLNQVTPEEVVSACNLRKLLVKAAAGILDAIQSYDL
jgi:hypothetical protein